MIRQTPKANSPTFQFDGKFKLAGNFVLNNCSVKTGAKFKGEHVCSFILPPSLFFTSLLYSSLATKIELPRQVISLV